MAEREWVKLRVRSWPEDDRTFVSEDGSEFPPPMANRIATLAHARWPEARSFLVNYAADGLITKITIEASAFTLDLTEEALQCFLDDVAGQGLTAGVQ